MSNHDEDLSQSWAAELTGSVGVPDALDENTLVSNDLADDVETFESYARDRDERLGLDALDDDRQDSEQETVDDQLPAERPRKQVPLGALQQERAKRQALQSELEAHRAHLAQLQAQQQQWQQWQAQQQLAAQQAAIPSFEDDPEGHITAKFALLEQAQQAQDHQRRYDAQLRFVEQEMAAAAPEVMRVEQEFAEQHIDYPQAAEFLNAELDARVRQQHPGATEAAHALAKKLAILAFAKDCQAKGLNPAQLIYNKSVELGYQANHRVPATAAKRVPGGSGGISAQRLGEMSDEEFDRLFQSMQRGATVRPAFG